MVRNQYRFLVQIFSQKVIKKLVQKGSIKFNRNADINTMVKNAIKFLLYKSKIQDKLSLENRDFH